MVEGIWKDVEKCFMLHVLVGDLYLTVIGFVQSVHDQVVSKLMGIRDMNLL